MSTARVIFTAKTRQNGRGGGGAREVLPLRKGGGTTRFGVVFKW